MEKKNVLIISHNCMSSFQNMGKTIKAMFGNFDKRNLYQLYFYPTYPNIDACSSFFRITDFDVIKSVITFNNNCGKTVPQEKISKANRLFENYKTEKSMKMVRLLKKEFLIFRDLIWVTHKWNTKELRKWIGDIKPEVIFFAAGDAIFSYIISMRISNILKKPLFVYFCDDYYSSNNAFRIGLGKLHHIFLRITIKKIINQADELIFISKSMEKEYRNKFGKQGHVIMTSFQSSINTKKQLGEKYIIMTYAGNLSLNRWKTLQLIGEALENINRRTSSKQLILNIYSPEKSIINKKLNIKNAMYFKGTVTKEQLEIVIENSDILLHVETFDRKYKKRLRHSISTKIADYLASNRVILAIGPSDLASVDYLRNNNAAYIIDKEEYIEKKIVEYFIDNKIDTRIIKNAKELSFINHDISKNSSKINELLYKKRIKKNNSYN